MQWGPKSDAKLFMHVISVGKVKLDYEALAVAMGDACSARAIRHRIAKLRAQAAEQSTPATASGSPSSIKRGPNKRSRTPVTPDISTATSSPATLTSDTKNTATATIAKTGGDEAPPAKNGTLGRVSARTKRTAAGKAKGSPLKVEIKAEEGDEWDEDVEVEVVTPSKKPRLGGSGA